MTKASSCNIITKQIFCHCRRYVMAASLRTIGQHVMGHLQAFRCLTGEPSCMVLMVSMCHPPSTGVRMVFVRSLLDAIVPSADSPRNTVSHLTGMAAQQGSILMCIRYSSTRLQTVMFFCRLPELRLAVQPTFYTMCMTPTLWHDSSQATLSQTTVVAGEVPGDFKYN